MRRAEIGRIAAIDFCDAAEAERFDVVAEQRARLRAVVHEQREPRAARRCLDAERAGAGEEIEHARTLNWVVIGMNEDVEHGLAQAVRGGANVTR